MRYKRSIAKGASFFFTVVTDKRRKFLGHDANVALLREAFRTVRSSHPFTIDAFVLLPDHLHCIWTLPEQDSDFSMRWRQIKRHYSRYCRDEFKGRGNERQSISPKASKPLGRKDIGSTRSGMRPI